jgi:hypothetical protein
MLQKLLVLFLFLFASGFSQDGRVVHHGFLNAEDYLELSAQQQLGYAMGVIDGMLIAPLFGAPDDGARLKMLGHCVEGMRNTQVKAILDTFLKQHPERWNDPMHAVAFAATQEACSRK